MNAPAYLRPEETDDLARMVTSLLSELWIVRDRVAVLEQLLIDKGGLAPGEVDNFQPSAAMSAELTRQRAEMVGAVVGAPLAARARDVDSILARAGMQRPAPSAD